MYTEKWLSQKLRETWPQGQGFLQSFELHAALGTPDLFVQHPVKGAFWLELKQVLSLQYQIPFRPAQPQWLKSNMEAGGRCWVLVIVKRTQELWLLSDGVILKDLGRLPSWLPKPPKFSCKLITTLGDRSGVGLAEKLLKVL